MFSLTVSTLKASSESAGSPEHLHEVGAQQPGHRFVQRTVEHDHAAERRDRVARQGLLVGRGHGLGHCHAAGVVVLHDNAGRQSELLQATPGRVKIEQVVERERTAVVSCSTAAFRLPSACQLGVPRGPLMRVLA